MDIGHLSLLLDFTLLLPYFDQAIIEDSIKMQKARDYVNFRQYRKEAKTRWGFSKERCKAEWKTLLGDLSVPKAKDQQGCLTMPALENFQPEA